MLCDPPFPGGVPLKVAPQSSASTQWGRGRETLSTEERGLFCVLSDKKRARDCPGKQAGLLPK